MSKLHAFITASMTTRYTLETPDGRQLTLSIGISNAELDSLLLQHQAKCYAYMTAFNPQSTTLSTVENEQRHQQLCSELDQRGFRYLTGKAIPDTGEWEPETCVFVFDMPHSVVLELCQAYAQDGAVVGAFESVPKLMFTNPKLLEEFRILLNDGNRLN
ncbi:MAG: hypothetical protein CVU43_04345 [Chloroflexi bacterium HGW-Chloroflexi-5]|jgi:hypothetical protein|nr:MAG: hypothetical protein CVU43_04345 [Chloroflexi bacterium HGW-Chloroflexi-5]